MSDSTARGALGWTHEPPTEEGWYWSRFQPCNAEDLNRWSPPMPRKIGGFINRVQRRETFREDNVQWWPARIQLPEEEIRESQLKEVAEKWAVAAESSRTSTIKELSGEGLLVQKLKQIEDEALEIYRRLGDTSGLNIRNAGKNLIGERVNVLLQVVGSETRVPWYPVGDQTEPENARYFALKDSPPLTVEEKIGPRWAEGGEDYMPEDTIAAVAFTHGWIMRGETERGDHGAAEYLEKAWDRAYDELVALFPSPIRKGQGDDVRGEKE